MKQRSHILNICLFLLFSTCIGILSAQNSKTKKADYYFENGAYYGAAELYSKIKQEKDSATFAYAQYRIGECNRKMNFPEIALGFYSNALLWGYNQSNIFVSLADVYLILGEYEEAKKNYDSYEKAGVEDPLLKNKKASCDLALRGSTYTSTEKIFPITTLNTTGSEYGISFWQGRLVYSSTGPKSDVKKEKERSLRTGFPYSKMYISSYTNKDFSPGEPVVNLNTDEANVGTFAYNPVTRKVYGTRCEANQGECYIFQADFKKNKFREKGKLKIGSEVYGMGHPFITSDGKRIYFTSKMAGGYGGADLWYVESIGKNKWGAPINLGPNINTPGNEVFPFVRGNALFFSSDGHPGLGGLDLFVATVEANSFSKPTNLFKPFNSSHDDFNLVISEEGDRTFFVTNRENISQSDDIYMYEGVPKTLMLKGKVIAQGTKEPLTEASVHISRDKRDLGELFIGKDSADFSIFCTEGDPYTFKATCDGGYQPVSLTIKMDSIFGLLNANVLTLQEFEIVIELPLCFVAGTVYEASTLEPIPGAIVRFIRNDTILFEAESGANGEYKFIVPNCGQNYTVSASKPDHKTESKNFLAACSAVDTTFQKSTGTDADIYLLKLVKGISVEIKDIYYEFDRARLLERSKKELDYLIELMIEYPEMEIEIGSHTDDRGTNPYNDRLSNERAKSVVDYLSERGIALSRLKWKGYGKRNLLIKHAQTEEEHQLNRRTVFTILHVGNISEHIQIKTRSTEDMLRTGTKNIMNLSGFWVQVYAAQVQSKEEIPIVTKTEELTKKTVEIRLEDDGMFRYYIGSFSHKEALEVQRLLKENNIHSFIKKID